MLCSWVMLPTKEPNPSVVVVVVIVVVVDEKECIVRRNFIACKSQLESDKRRNETMLRPSTNRIQTNAPAPDSR